MYIMLLLAQSNLQSTHPEAANLTCHESCVMCSYGGSDFQDHHLSQSLKSHISQTTVQFTHRSEIPGGICLRQTPDWVRTETSVCVCVCFPMTLVQSDRQEGSGISDWDPAQTGGMNPSFTAATLRKPLQQRNIKRQKNLYRIVSLKIACTA